jgi:cob(I)alamin adenosyltransferase
MGHRLSRIYTRTGDDGSTGLGNGARIEKPAPRIEALGAVDETNCALGVVLAEQLPAPLRECLSRIQHELFEVGGELSVPGMEMIGSAHVARLEEEVDGFNADLPPLREFILPGGTRGAAACHLARAICRRAERRCWALASIETVNPQLLKYLNRLSDLLFVLARRLARDAGVETLWRHERASGSDGPAE